MVELRVLNLNFWGIPFISKDRQERAQALVEVLGSPDASWDFVVLEEVWSDRDYRFISENVRNNYPHSYYFYSGVIGSGVCVLSKGQIISVLCHVYSLNGYAHKLQHGDWFGGKVAGLCQIFHKGLHINLYATHIHAEYNRKSDEYLAHRIAQAYELSQFIRMTSSSGHAPNTLNPLNALNPLNPLNIVAGDFNFEPDDLGYAIVRRFADLKDAWNTRLNYEGEGQGGEGQGGEEGNTCNTPDNVYSVLENKGDKVPRGKRIDFIMYGTVGNGISVACTSCRPVLNRIPNSKICYSDHKGLEAVFQIGSPETVHPSVFSPAVGSEAVPTFVNTFDSALSILESGLQRTKNNRTFFFVIFFVAFVFLLGTAEVNFQFFVLKWLLSFLRIVLVSLIILCFWTVFVLNRIEFHALLSAKNAMVIQRKWDDAQGKTSGRNTTETN